MVAQMGQPPFSRFYTAHFRFWQWKYRQYVTAFPEPHLQTVAAHLGRWHYFKLAPALLIRAVEFGDGFCIRDKMWHNKKGKDKKKGLRPAGPKIQICGPAYRIGTGSSLRLAHVRLRCFRCCSRSCKSPQQLIMASKVSAASTSTQYRTRFRRM